MALDRAFHWFEPCWGDEQRYARTCGYLDRICEGEATESLKRALAKRFEHASAASLDPEMNALSVRNAELYNRQMVVEEEDT